MMNKAFDENRTSYYRLHVPAGLISNRLRVLANMIDWIEASRQEIKLFVIGEFNRDEYIIFIQCDSPEIMVDIAKRFDVFKFNPSQNDLDKAFLVMG
ncbi:MAG TPA: hypothetical protein VK151_08745 [Fluviicola sp.]|nr:hypothetical protein [Fluviicola sp.]